MPDLIFCSDAAATNRAVRSLCAHRQRGRRALGRAVARALEPLEARQLLSANSPVISEFVANNQLGLVDDYGLRQDWIEVYNPSGSALNLAGWHLTDSSSNPGKSTFPAGTN